MNQYSPIKKPDFFCYAVGQGINLSGKSDGWGHFGDQICLLSLEEYRKKTSQLDGWWKGVSMDKDMNAIWAHAKPSWCSCAKQVFDKSYADHKASIAPYTPPPA